MAAAGADHGHLDVQEWSPRERRVGDRIPASLRVLVRRRPGMRSVAARVQDISAYGLGVRAPGHFSIGEPVEVSIEAEVPLRVHLGFDMESIVIDGPLQAHTVVVTGEVVRCEQRPDRCFDVGIEFGDDCDPEERLQVEMFLAHLRGDGWV